VAAYPVSKEIFPHPIIIKNARMAMSIAFDQFFIAFINIISNPHTVGIAMIYVLIFFNTPK
jgi:hypothetical protein